MSKQKKPLNILALEPYYDGSHKAFLDEWIKRSVHHWTLMTLEGKAGLLLSACDQTRQASQFRDESLQGYDGLFEKREMCRDSLGRENECNRD